MNDKPPIVIEANTPEIRVIAPGAPNEAGRPLAVRGDSGVLFRPAVNPEMRGRRPSGQIVEYENVPKDALPKPIGPPRVTESGERIIVPKRAAKAVAEDLAGVPARCWDGADGRKNIILEFPLQPVEFSGREYFDALASLKHWLEKRRKRK